MKTLYTSTQYGYVVQANISSASAEVLDALWAWGASQFAAHVGNTHWRDGSKNAKDSYDLGQWLVERGTGQNRTALSAPAADILLAAEALGYGKFATVTALVAGLSAQGVEKVEAAAKVLVEERTAAIRKLRNSL